MKVRIIGGDRRVAPHGNRVETWHDGTVHEVSAALGESLVRDGWAELADGPSETKVVAPSEPDPGARRKRG